MKALYQAFPTLDPDGASNAKLTFKKISGNLFIMINDDLDRIFQIVAWESVANNSSSTPLSRLEARLNIIGATTLVEAADYDPGPRGLVVREHVLEDLEQLAPYARSVAEDPEFSGLRGRFIETANALTDTHNIFKTAPLKAGDAYKLLEVVNGIAVPSCNGP